MSLFIGYKCRNWGVGIGNVKEEVGEMRVLMGR